MLDNYHDQIATLNDQIEAVRLRAVQRDAIRDDLPHVREQVGQHRYRLECLEHALAQLEEDIEILSGFTVGSFMDTLLGRRDRKREDCQEQMGEVKEQYGECQQKILEWDSKVQELESQLASMETVEAEVLELCDAKRQAMIDSGDDRAKHIVDVRDRLDQLKQQEHSLGQALDTGKHLMHQFDAMITSLNRTKKKRSLLGPLGLVGYVVHEVYTNRGTYYPSEMVRDGLMRLSKQIEEIDFPDPGDFENEILRLGMVMSDYHDEMGFKFKKKLKSNPQTLQLIMEQVQTVVTFLEEQWSRIHKGLLELQQESDALIE